MDIIYMGGQELEIRTPEFAVRLLADCATEPEKEKLGLL